MFAIILQSGRTPLQKAMEHPSSNEKVIVALIEANAAVNVVDQVRKLLSSIIVYKLINIAIHFARYTQKCCF